MASEKMDFTDSTNAGYNQPKGENPSVYTMSQFQPILINGEKVQTVVTEKCIISVEEEETVQYKDEPAEDYLIWSVINTFLFCPVLGIIALVFSALVITNVKKENQEKAKFSSKTAKTLNIAATTVGVLIGFAATIGFIVWILVYYHNVIKSGD